MESPETLVQLMVNASFRAQSGPIPKREGIVTPPQVSMHPGFAIGIRVAPMIGQ